MELAAELEEDDAWVEAQALIDTVEDHELTDPSIVAERLLYRLFHERGVRVFDPVALQENCSCSRERIVQVLQQMDTTRSARRIGRRRVDGARSRSRCEFCGDPATFDSASTPADDQVRA